MPVFNAENYLHESIESILKQTFGDFEFLIMDDGSTDKTPKILADYARKDPRIRLFHQENSGIVTSLNTLIDHAQANIIARMDADDIAEIERFEKQYRHLEKHPEIVLLGTFAQKFRANSSKEYLNDIFIEDPMNRWFLTFTSAFIHSSVVMKKDALLKAGKYRENAYPTEDYDLWIRIKRYGKIENLSGNLIRYRMSENSISGINFKQQLSRRDHFGKINFEDIYQHQEIPSIETIEQALKNYSMHQTQRFLVAKIACLTGCFLIEKKEHQKAKSFFALAIHYDKKRVDAIINLILGMLGCAIFIAIDGYLAAKKGQIKIRFFRSEKTH